MMKNHIPSGFPDWISVELRDRFYQNLAESVDSERTTLDHIQEATVLASQYRKPVDNGSAAKKVLLVGYCGAGNLGANIRVKCLSDFFSAYHIECTILLMGWDDYWNAHERTIILDEYFPLFFLKEIPTYDAVITCEGSMFKSFFSNSLTLMQSAALLIAQAYGIPTLAYGAEIGKMHDWIEKSLVPLLTTIPIFSRSETSYQRGTSLGLTVFEGVDSAWRFTGEKFLDKKDEKVLKIVVCPVDPFQFPLKLITGDKIGSTGEKFRDQLYFDANPGRANQLKELMTEIGQAIITAMQGKKYRVDIVAMDEMDNNACEVYQKLFAESSILHIATASNSTARLKVLAEADLCITQRYHAAVLCMAQFINVIGIAIDERIPNLFAELDAGSVVVNYLDPELELKLGAEITQQLETGEKEKNKNADFVKNSLYRLDVMNENVLRFLQLQWQIHPDKIDLNGIWNNALLEVLILNGLRKVLVANGSRNMNLLHQSLENAQLEVLQFNQEAQMAFFGLGHCHKTRKPLLLVTTSGSAMLHCLPAIAEAYKQNLPLILLTADRPAYMLAANAPQTLDHLSLTKGIATRQFAIIEPAGEANAALKYARQLKELNDVLKNDLLRGPIHINLPQRGHLGALGVFDYTDYPFIPKSTSHPFLNIRSEGNRMNIEKLQDKIKTTFSGKGIIVSGPIPTEGMKEVIKLAEAVGFPILSDVSANYRQNTENNVAHGDILAYGAWMNSQVYDVIILIGSSPVALSVNQFLKVQKCPILILEYNKVTYYPGNEDAIYLSQPQDEDWRNLGKVLSNHDREWLKVWKRRDRLISVEMCAIVKHMPFSELYTSYQIFNCAKAEVCFIGNSLPIRHANLLTHPSSKFTAFYCNRGLSGIDGHLSAFAGLIHQSAKTSVCVIGDLTFYHDVAGLEVLAKYYRTSPQSITIYVINNGGGKIFDFIRLGKDSALPMPKQDVPTVSIERLCKAFELPYYVCEGKRSLHHIFKIPGIKIVELKFNEAWSITDQYSVLVNKLLQSV